MVINEKGVITENRQVSSDLFVMELSLPAMAEKCRPGQFVHVLVNNQADPLLRRPLSLYDVENGHIRLLYRVVGKGTAILTHKKINDCIDVIGPLGRGFSLCEQERAVLVGGGVGVAPLVFLARELKARGCEVTFLHGVARESQLVVSSYLANRGIDVLPATMDGSKGYRGLVTDLLSEQVDPKQCDYIYTCGPEAMMAAVADYAARYNIPGEVSLEENMACGVGACLGCARRLKRDDQAFVKVCKDGPVFSISEVELSRS